jgi:DNA-binding beta-propeller fold protein YncE
MTGWKMAAALILAAALGACGGGNSTKAGITITASSATIGANTVDVPVNGTEQFAASVTGISTSLVEWQVCLPGVTTSTEPTACTSIPNVTARKGETLLTGYGTITQNGFYTAPSTVPTQIPFVILATSPADSTAFGIFQVIIDSGVRIQLTPLTPTIDSGESLQFMASVTGTPNTSVTWKVDNVAGGNAQTTGTISTSGLYSVAAGITGSETITAVSGADGVTEASTTINVSNGTPAVSALSPTTIAQGSVEQDVYLTGSDLTSNGTVILSTAPPTSIPSCVVQPTAVPCYLSLSGSLLRVPLPASALQTSGPLQLSFQLQSGPISNTEPLSVVTVRPSIIAITPSSLTASASSPSVGLTGGFFTQGSPATAVQFDGGNEGSVTLTPGVGDPTREMSVALPTTGVLGTPGLYAITAQNPGVAGMSATNIAVTPSSIAAALGPNSTVSLGAGTQPSSIALDSADGVAVVAETGTNSVALISLASPMSPPTIVSVGHQPTSVAVDDLLAHPLAVVVNSADNTVSVFDLTVALAGAGVTPQTIPLTGFTPTTSMPVAVGVNPQTHRALVANASTNVATILSLAAIPDTSLSAACQAGPCALLSVGGNLTNFGTGGSPTVAVDPGLNWAVVTPGGAGAINIVDLGFGSPSPGSGGRAPSTLASLSLSATTRGVGINTETHMALFTDSNTGAVTEFSLLDNTVASVTNTNTPLNVPGEDSAAVNPFQNIGLAVNNSGSGTASIIDLGHDTVLQTVSNLTTASGSSQSVIVDPATNNALIANSGAGTIAVVSLGSVAPKPLQVLEVSPQIAYTTNGSLSLTITGMGFSAGANVLLDGVSLGAGETTVVSARKITATVPAALLTSARRFALQVQNANLTVSNAESVTVIQPITVGTSPAGVAVDPNRDAALVTNSGSGDVSVVSLAPAAISPQSLGPVGVVGSPVTVHVDPRAVALLPRLGVGVVANYESNDVTLIDYSEVFQATPYAPAPATQLCVAGFICIAPAGVAMNPDTGGFLVTDSNVGTTSSALSQGIVTGANGTTAATLTVTGGAEAIDQTPGDLAIAPSFDIADPTLTYAAIAAAGQTSVIDFLNTTSQLVVGRTTGVAEPAGVVYDSLNKQFLVSDALNNDILIVNPLTFVPIAVRGGFNPTSIDYNQQTSTIVAVNGATRTLSLLDYLCPPSSAAPACTSPHVRVSYGLVGSQVSTTTPLGPHFVALDPRLNLAVLLDPNDNRILLVPLP